jgi:AcrR family transcriptional regulator
VTALVEQPKPKGSGAPAALLEAAFRVFGARGYRAVRLEEVADAAGVTKGAIYYYLDSKEDLFRRALSHRHHAVFAEIAEALQAQQGPTSAKIRFVLRKVWQRWVEPGWGQAFRLLVGEVSVEFPAVFRTWAEEGPIHGWRLLRTLIEEGVATGEFRQDVDADVAARLVLSGLMLQAALHVHLGLDELAPCDHDRIFDSSVDLFMHGLAMTHQRLPSP